MLVAPVTPVIVLLTVGHGVHPLFLALPTVALNVFAGHGVHTNDEESEDAEEAAAEYSPIWHSQSSACVDPCAPAVVDPAGQCVQFVEDSTPALYVSSGQAVHAPSFSVEPVSAS